MSWSACPHNNHPSSRVSYRECTSSSTKKPSPQAHIADTSTAATDTDSTINRSEVASTLTDTTDVNALLATALGQLGQLGDHPLAQNLITDALNSINE